MLHKWDKVFPIFSIIQTLRGIAAVRGQGPVQRCCHIIASIYSAIQPAYTGYGCAIAIASRRNEDRDQQEKNENGKLITVAHVFLCFFALSCDSVDLKQLRRSTVCSLPRQVSQVLASRL